MSLNKQNNTGQNYTDLFPFECRVMCNKCNHKQFKGDNCTTCGTSFKIGVLDKKTPSYAHYHPKDINGKS
jgi:methionyl-tRNA synthetase